MARLRRRLTVFYSHLPRAASLKATPGGRTFADSIHALGIVLGSELKGAEPPCDKLRVWVSAGDRLK